MLLGACNLISFPVHVSQVDCVRENQVVIISGATGCGKTTQIPQFILEDCVAADATARCNMICTQPRRLSAIAVSERVAAERGERIGDTIGCACRTCLCLASLRVGE